LTHARTCLSEPTRASARSSRLFSSLLRVLLGRYSQSCPRKERNTKEVKANYIIIIIIIIISSSSNTITIIITVGRYAITRKVAGSSPDEVNEFFQFTSSSRNHHSLWVSSASNRKECRKTILELKGGRHGRLKTLPQSRGRLSRQRVILDIRKIYRLPWPITGIALLFFPL
jgi:hypothetical protein